MHISCCALFLLHIFILLQLLTIELVVRCWTSRTQTWRRMWWPWSRTWEACTLTWCAIQPPWATSQTRSTLSRPSSEFYNTPSTLQVGLTTGVSQWNIEHLNTLFRCVVFNYIAFTTYEMLYIFFWRNPTNYSVSNRPTPTWCWDIVLFLTSATATKYLQSKKCQWLPLVEGPQNEKPVTETPAGVEGENQADVGGSHSQTPSSPDLDHTGENRKNSHGLVTLWGIFVSTSYDHCLVIFF